MKKMTVLALTLLLAPALALPALCAEDNALIPPAAQQRQAPQGETLDQGPVPEDQLELMKKQDQAIKQRDKAMKMRLKQIKEAEQGSKRGAETLPAPPK